MQSIAINHCICSVFTCHIVGWCLWRVLFVLHDFEVFLICCFWGGPSFKRQSVKCHLVSGMMLLYSMCFGLCLLTVGSEKSFFDFLQLSNLQINAMSWMVMQFVACNCFWGWPPSDSQCLGTFKWCDSICAHYGSLVCFLSNILLKLFTGAQCLHFQGLGTPRPWTSAWTSRGWAIFYIMTFPWLVLGL